LLFSLLCYGGILLVGRSGTDDPGLLAGLVILAALGLPLAFFPGQPLLAFGSIGLKVTVALLIGIPMQVSDGREELLFYAIIADCLLYLPEFWGIVVALGTLTLSLLNQHAWKAWDTVVPAASLGDLSAYGGRLAVVLVLAAGIRVLFLIWQHCDDQRIHLETSIQAIMQANLQLQGYAVQVEHDTTEAERKRITREVHDIIGYSLTNQLMVLEACLLLADKDTAKLKTTLVEARRQLQDGLEEIRRELRHLRESETVSRTSLSELHYLCRIFQEATGVQVRLEMALHSESLSPDLFQCLYRIIQQGLTNSFFHGRASLVEVLITEQQGNLQMSIIDNGHGGQAGQAAEQAGTGGALREGIGLAGMAERLVPFGGSLGHAYLESGFQLNVTVPLPRNDDPRPEETP
jgi:signal transduction histidine kinase